MGQLSSHVSISLLQVIGAQSSTARQCWCLGGSMHSWVRLTLCWGPGCLCPGFSQPDLRWIFCCFSTCLCRCYCYFILAVRFSGEVEICLQCHRLILWVLASTCVHGTKCPSFYLPCGAVGSAVCGAGGSADFPFIRCCPL